MRIVDTHAHIYHADESLYPMIESPSRPIEGTGGAEHLQRERETHQIDRVVVVQTGSAYKWDNRLLTDTVRARPDWTTGVCNLSPADPDSPAAFARMVREDNVRALRLEPAPDGRFDHDGSRRLLQTAADIGAAICAHINAAALPELDALLTAFPHVPVVLDHCAYPVVADGPDSALVRDVTALARHRNLHAKLTFLVTASQQAYPFADTHEIARRMLGAFGADRCMWGSDFPCEFWLRGKASYGQHLAVVRDELGLSEADQAQVMGETALRVFFPSAV